jgi:hypothetical protein
LKKHAASIFKWKSKGLAKERYNCNQGATGTRDVNKLCGVDSSKKGSFVNEEYGKELRMELPSLQKTFSQHLSPSILACPLSLTKHPIFDATSSGSLTAPFPVLQTFSLNLLSCATSLLPWHWR